MKVGIVADDAGFELKRKLVSLLMIEGYSVVDFGKKLYDNESGYPEALKDLIRAISRMDVQRGVVISGDGEGAKSRANQTPGVQAEICYDDSDVRRGVEDSDLNILCLEARFAGIAIAWNLTVSFLEATFTRTKGDPRQLASIAQ